MTPCPGPDRCPWVADLLAALARAHGVSEDVERLAWGLPGEDRPTLITTTEE